MKPLVLRRLFYPHITRYLRFNTAICLIAVGLILAALTLEAAIHPAFISWLPDQKISTGNFATQYFKVDKYDDSGALTVSIDSPNPNFMPSPTVTACGATCGDVGTNYMITFSTPYPSPTPGTTPATTITIKAKTGTNGPMAYTSFTLRKDSAQNPPRRLLK